MEIKQSLQIYPLPFLPWWKLMDSTLRCWTGHVLHPFRQSCSDLALCTRWCDLTLFSSELGLFPENETKHSL